MRAQTLLTAYAVLAVLGGVRGAAIIEDHTESYAVRVAACVPPTNAWSVGRRQSSRTRWQRRTT